MSEKINENVLADEGKKTEKNAAELPFAKSVKDAVLEKTDLSSMFMGAVEAGGKSEEVLNVEDRNVYKLPVYMLRQSRVVKGKTYYDYFLQFAAKVKGNPVVHKVNFQLSQEFADAYENLGLAFDEENKSPLSIVRTTITDSKGKTNVSYSAKVSYFDDMGIECDIKLRPRGANDRQEFEYAIKIFQAHGYLD